MSENSTQQRSPPAWRCDNGTWTRVPDPAQDGRIAEQGEHDEWLAGAGFIPAGEWFGPSPAVQVFERAQADGECEWRIEVAITPTGRHVIMIRRLPDLLDILAKLAVIATADERGQKLANSVTFSAPAYPGWTGIGS